MTTQRSKHTTQRMEMETEPSSIAFQMQNQRRKDTKKGKRKFDNKRIAIQRMKLGIESIRIRCFVGVGAASCKTNRRWKYTFLRTLLPCLFLVFFTQIENKLTLKINQTKSEIENEMKKPKKRK